MKCANAKALGAVLIAAMAASSLLGAPQKDAASHEGAASVPRSREGKKLFGSSDALRVARVSSPRISPDGTRVAYLVAENDTEKEQAWKFVTHLWGVTAAGLSSEARQFTG